MLSGERSGSRWRRWSARPSSVHGSLLVVPHDRGVLGRRFEEEPVGIGLEANVPVGIPDFILVVSPFAHAGNENLPHPGSAQRAHGVAAAVPVVEIAHHADALGVGRPDRETGAGDAVDHPQLRAQLFVNPPLVAFAKEIEIGLTQRGQKGIRIAGALTSPAASVTTTS